MRLKFGSFLYGVSPLGGDTFIGCVLDLFQFDRLSSLAGDCIIVYLLSTIVPIYLTLVFVACVL